MTELSPAAQAVYEAAIEQSEYPNDAEWVVINALRAAADQVVPEEPVYGGDQRWMFERDARQACRQELLAIAAELEGQ